MNVDARILIVEDNEINLRLMQAQISHLEFEHVKSFAEATKALGWLVNNPCDLVLTDCRMEPMDGIELTQEIRKLDAQANRHTIIIAVTAGAMPNDLKGCVQAGMDDYLIKPIQIAALQAMLCKWLPCVPDP